MVLVVFDKAEFFSRNQVIFNSKEEREEKKSRERGQKGKYLKAVSRASWEAFADQDCCFLDFWGPTGEEEKDVEKLMKKKKKEKKEINFTILILAS